MGPEKRKVGLRERGEEEKREEEWVGGYVVRNNSS